jgi:hypothetical protein
VVANYMTPNLNKNLKLPALDQVRLSPKKDPHGDLSSPQPKHHPVFSYPRPPRHGSIDHSADAAGNLIDRTESPGAQRAAALDMINQEQLALKTRILNN